MRSGGPTQPGITETNPFGCSSFYATSKVGRFICKYLCDASVWRFPPPLHAVCVIVQICSGEQVQCVTSLLEMLSSNHPNNILFSFLFLRFHTCTHTHTCKKHNTKHIPSLEKCAFGRKSAHLCSIYISCVVSEILMTSFGCCRSDFFIDLCFRCGCPLMLVCFHALSLLMQVTLLGCLSCKKAG